ncbi:pirin family protein [Marinoscillum sp. MHG1-6]|uniref:pirin family protein n=1 Tax=Marinoscillum sp. MHG1-6 TaxID=2959627 RepID=UPI002158530F|nr:pirin family protein [Marinoscillum sp. MHG1-6]
MKTVLHKADTRGTAFFGWLHSRHTFSFGRYYDPDRIHFGALRVLNDDIVEPGMGFGTHPHDNMEIVSIPLQGDLEHKDSTGNTEVIRTGDVQIMSAGSGLTHSEYNHSKDDKVNFLQLWVFPKEENITPRYDQKTFKSEDRNNQVQTVVAPDNEQALWINQDAWFSLADINKGLTLDYTLHSAENGVYIFVIDGLVDVNGLSISRRDGLGVYETEKLEIKAGSDSKLLLVEVPMQ